MDEHSERKKAERNHSTLSLDCVHVPLPLFSTDVTIEDEGDKKGKDL